MLEAQVLNRECAKRKNTPNQMQQFCALSDRLDTVAEMHYRWSSISEELQSIFTGVITFWMLDKQMAMVTHIFMMYIAANDLISSQADRDTLNFPLEVVFYGLTLVGIVCWETFALTKECARAAYEVSNYLTKKLRLLCK